MRRRDVLRGAGGIVGLAGAGAVSGDLGATERTQEPYEPLGRVAVDGAAEAVVGDDGTTVYVAATSGFATVDVSDPADPTVLAERRDLRADHEDGPMSEIIDVKVEGDRLLVAGPGEPRTGGARGLLVFDVSDPADPREVGFHPTRNFVHNCFLHEGIAYLPQGRANHRLHVVDVRDDEPELLAEWDPADHDDAWEDVDGGFRNVHDLWVHDGRAYLAGWDAGTFVLDVADPAAPEFLARVGGHSIDELRDAPPVSRLQPPGNHHYVQVSDDGSLLAVGVESWDAQNLDGGGPGGVHLWDVSSLSDPQRLSTIEPLRARDETFSSGTWTTSHNFDLAGDRLYTSWYQGGVRIHDVSDPADPERLAAWRDHRETAFWTLRTAADDTLVASSTAAAPALSGLDEAVYTFPDRAGEQADPPAFPTPTPSPTPSPTPNETTPGDTTPTDTPTPSPTSTATATPTATPSPTADPVTGDGFGVLAALAALGGAAWWRRRE